MCLCMTNNEEKKRGAYCKIRKMIFKSSCLALFIILTIFFATITFRIAFALRDKNSGSSGGNSPSEINLRPIIGILTQEFYQSPIINENNINEFVDPTESYIAASYVKFVEGAGARVVPILINQNQTYYKTIFSGLNGILFPGGGVYFNSSGYAVAGKILYNLARDANDRGDYFPLWGTCLGFEFLVYATLNGKEIFTNCGANNVLNKLKFTKDFSSSKLYGNAPKSVIKILSTQKVAANFHHFCLTQENFTKFGLEEQIRILSWTYDPSFMITYVSSFESTRYPFFGVQFHPEKNIYEWTTKENLPHSKDAILSAQYFADFLVGEVRKNSHRFQSEEEENRYLIYNFNPTFSGLKGSTFSQQYMFPL